MCTHTGAIRLWSTNVVMIDLWCAGWWQEVICRYLFVWVGFLSIAYLMELSGECVTNTSRKGNWCCFQFHGGFHVRVYEVQMVDKSFRNKCSCSQIINLSTHLCQHFVSIRLVIMASSQKLAWRWWLGQVRRESHSGTSTVVPGILQRGTTFPLAFAWIMAT